MAEKTKNKRLPKETSSGKFRKEIHLHEPIFTALQEKAKSQGLLLKNYIEHLLYLDANSGD